MVENGHASVRVLMARGPAASVPWVQTRRWSGGHDVGVVPGFENIAHEILNIDGHRFVQMTLTKTSYKLIVQ